MESIFNKKSKKHLDEFIEVCSQFMDIDKVKAKRLAEEALKYYTSSKKVKGELRHFQELEKKWYLSLENGGPDYSVYNDKYYLFDVWTCWIIYSRKYLLSINSDKSLAGHDSHGNWYNLKSIVSDIGEVSNIIDLGCGFGYTTAGLKELFPSANVYGTNVEDSYQFKIAEHFGNLYNFKLIPSIKSLEGTVDLVFASEYFEHIEDPINHLKEVLSYQPNYLIIANAFTAKSLGHFNQYIYKNPDLFPDVGVYKGKDISRKFNQHLRKSGYEKVYTTLWNNRPSYWRKIKNG